MFKEVLTDSRKHNPSSFVYMVHGLLDWERNNSYILRVNQKIEEMKNPNSYFHASLVGHLDYENAVKGLGYYNGEISQLGTFGLVGLIIEPSKEEQVQIAWNCDIGSPCEQEQLKDFANQHKGKIKSPLTLLTKTVGDESIKYNELVLQGHHETKIDGVFFRKFKTDSEYQGKWLKELVDKRLKTEVPLVEIPLPKEKDYKDINPKDLETRKRLDSLRTQCEIMQSHMEFTNPPRSRFLESGDDIWREVKDFYKF